MISAHAGRLGGKDGAWDMNDAASDGDVELDESTAAGEAKSDESLAVDGAASDESTADGVTELPGDVCADPCSSFISATLHPYELATPSTCFQNA